MEKRSWIRRNLIGSGSFGAVSLASDKSTGRIFAVKSVSLDSCSSQPLSILSLENEIEILKKVNSPHIVSYIGDDMTRELNWGMYRNLHMEFVPGGTVAELAAKREGLEERELRGYARCLTRALHYLHSTAGVVHCDVKGRNLLVGSGIGGTKLSDFGSAKHLTDIEKGEVLISGTPHWMAPEVARGENPSTASDVWSLGCTVIEMATGLHPWAECGPSNDDDVPMLLVRIGYSEKLPKYPGKLSNDGKDFLNKCLKLNPIDRWGCDKLLRHPFLADVADADLLTGPSPRGVLDWDNEEFGDESEIDFALDHEFRGIEEEEDIEVFCMARERVRALCCEEQSWEWSSSDGWEAVRWDQEEEEEEEEEEERRTDSQIMNFERGEIETSQMGGDGVSQLAASCRSSPFQERRRRRRRRRREYSCSIYGNFNCGSWNCGGCFCCDRCIMCEWSCSRKCNCSCNCSCMGDLSRQTLLVSSIELLLLFSYYCLFESIRLFVIMIMVIKINIWYSFNTQFMFEFFSALCTLHINNFILFYGDDKT